MRPLLLDLFCGAGGAGMGYHLAGFDVVGVDIEPQPNYPFRFIQHDALTFPLDGYAAIHASPPCQAYSRICHSMGIAEGRPKLVGVVMDRLARSGKPWIVENVVGAPMPNAFTLCGASFGLGASGLDLNRHRLFAANFFVLAPQCQHRRGKTLGVYGHGTNSYHRAKLGRCIRVAEMRQAMGIDWMNRAELSQAIPPAYTNFIGSQLRVVLDRAVA